MTAFLIVGVGCTPSDRRDRALQNCGMVRLFLDGVVVVIVSVGSWLSGLICWSVLSCPRHYCDPPF
jgi:hypothetical protein